MNDPIREEGFLVYHAGNGLSGAKFHKEKKEAETAARSMLPKADPVISGFPVYVIPVIRFTTEEIEQIRGR